MEEMERSILHRLGHNGPSGLRNIGQVWTCGAGGILDMVGLDGTMEVCLYLSAWNHGGMFISQSMEPWRYVYISVHGTNQLHAAVSLSTTRV